MGIFDVLFKGESFKLPRAFDAYVMENILFKISFPAEFHAQTAVECAIALHEQIKHRLNDIEKIILTTQESAVRIISKTGPLYNYADRDHCLQYMVAAALLFGDLKADYYEDEFAEDPRLNLLRDKMTVVEEPQFTQDYLDPNKRSIANAIQIYFKDGSQTEKVQIDYPIGHRRRREEGISLLIKKFETNAVNIFSRTHVDKLLALFLEPAQLEKMPVQEFMDLFAV